MTNNKNTWQEVEHLMIMHMTSSSGRKELEANVKIKMTSSATSYVGNL
jgi:hypothetical protein